jgi:(2R)-sulfolactate sulfo-lyase subunit alpha
MRYEVNENLGFLAHHQDDMVAVAVRDVEPGGAEFTSLDSGARRPIEVLEQIPLGHKVALIDIAKGSDVIEYGQRVGIAQENIAIGEMVHVHNIRSARWQLA